MVAWRCSPILSGPHRGIGLLRKGVLWDLLAKGPELVECSKWLAKTALNAHMVMSAYLPSMAHQSVWHATILPEVLQSFQSIFMGVVAPNYPDAWWKQTLKSAITTLHLGDTIRFQCGLPGSRWAGTGQCCGPATGMHATLPCPLHWTCNGLTEGGRLGVSPGPFFGMK